MENFQKCGLDMKSLWCEKRSSHSCRPNSLVSLPFRGSVGKWSNSPVDVGLVWELVPLAFPVTQWMHVSHFSSGVLTQGLDVVSKEKNASREEWRESCVFLLFLYFFPKCVEEQNQADVQLVPTDEAGRTESSLIGQFWLAETCTILDVKNIAYLLSTKPKSITHTT